MKHMKSLSTLIVLFSLFASSFMSVLGKSAVKFDPCCKPKEHKERKGKGCIKLLHLKNKTNIISEPGTYLVQNSMKLKKGTTAILVQSDNVHINLCDKVLKGRGNDFNDPTIGIDFSGHSNVSVSNGTVQDFSVFGIFAQTVNGIIIEDISALRNGSPSVVSPVNNVPCGGIFVGGTDDLGDGGTVTENVTIRRVLCDENFLWGITLPFCVNVSVTDSDFVRTHDTSLVDFGGISFAEAFNGGFWTLNGFPLASNYTFENCKFNNALATNRPETRYCDGFVIGSNVFFASFPGNILENITFIDCEFNGNLCTDNAVEANGCALIHTGNGAFIRCRANNNTCINEASTLTTGHAGGLLAYVSHGIVYQDCIASGQQSVGAQSLYASGIVLVNNSDVRAINTIASGNHADAGSAYGWQTENIQGSTLQNGQIDAHHYQWVSCVANNNTSDNVTQPVAGFQLIGIDGASINECEASENSFAGITVQEFVTDISTMQNLIVENTNLVANGCYGVDDSINSNTHVFVNNIGLSNNGLNFNLQPLNVAVNNISLNEGLSPACMSLRCKKAIQGKSMPCDIRKQAADALRVPALIEKFAVQG